MWGRWQVFCAICQQARYCDPDNLNMYMPSDWYVHSLQEIVRNAISNVNPRNAPTLTSISCLIFMKPIVRKS